MKAAHYTLASYGKWGFTFTSPFGMHRLEMPRTKAEKEMADIMERHRAKALADGAESEIYRPFFTDDTPEEVVTPESAPEPPAKPKCKCRQCSKPAMLGTDICRDCALKLRAAARANHTSLR